MIDMGVYIIFLFSFVMGDKMLFYGSNLPCIFAGFKLKLAKSMFSVLFTRFLHLIVLTLIKCNTIDNRSF